MQKIAKDTINKLKKKFEDELQMGDTTLWKDADYKKIEDLVLQKTNIHVSRMTLKRLFGKIETLDYYLPQKKTLDALAIYVGYQNFIDYSRKQKIVRNNKEIIKSWTTKKRVFTYLGVTVLSILVLYLAIQLFLSYPLHSEESKSNTIINFESELFELELEKFEKLSDTLVRAYYLYQVDTVIKNNMVFISFSDGNFISCVPKKRVRVIHDFKIRESNFYRAQFGNENQRGKSVTFFLNETEKTILTFTDSDDKKQQLHFTGDSVLNYSLNNLDFSPNLAFWSVTSFRRNFFIRSSNFQLKFKAEATFNQNVKNQCNDMVFKLKFENDQMLFRFRNNSCQLKRLPKLIIGQKEYTSKDFPYENVLYDEKNPELDFSITADQDSIKLIVSGLERISFPNQTYMGYLKGLDIEMKGITSIKTKELSLKDNQGLIINNILN